MIDVERYEGRAWLDWWANSSTLLGSVGITVIIAATGSGWTAHGHLVGDGEDDREGFVFLYELDPVFALRFDGDDNGALPVIVHDIEDGGRRFHLTEYRGPAERTIDHRIAL
jgi:hypothetical protein